MSWFFLFLTWPFILSLSPRAYYFCPSCGNMKCSSIMALKLSGISEVMEHVRPHLIVLPGKDAPMGPVVSFKYSNLLWNSRVCHPRSLSPWHLPKWMNQNLAAPWFKILQSQLSTREAVGGGNFGNSPPLLYWKPWENVAFCLFLFLSLLCFCVLREWGEIFSQLPWLVLTTSFLICSCCF